MKKLKSLFACMFGLLILTGCSNNFSNNAQIGVIGDEKPATMKEIKFDGIYVQTDNATWAIAFKSYNVENDLINIKGSFYVPNEEDFGNILELETKLNKENSPYVISYNETFDSMNSVVYSNLENTKWTLNGIERDNLCYFTLCIDISPLIECNKLLGELIINGYFNVFYDFNGEMV